MKKLALLCALFCLFIAPKLVSAQGKAAPWEPRDLLGQPLADMQRVSIVIGDLGHEEKQLGLTVKSLSHPILVALKRDVPKLKIEYPEAPRRTGWPTFRNVVYVRITSSDIDPYNVASSVEFRIMRQVDIAGDSGKKIDILHATVWDESKTLTGPKHNMGPRIRDFLIECVAKFAAQYNKENP